MLHICRELFMTRIICSIEYQSIYHPCLAHDTAPQINCHFVAMVTLPSGAPQRCEPAIWRASSFIICASHTTRPLKSTVISLPWLHFLPEYLTDTKQRFGQLTRLFPFRTRHKKKPKGTGPYDGRKGSGNEAMRMSEMEKNKKHSSSVSSYYPQPYATTHLSGRGRNDDGTDSGYHQVTDHFSRLSLKLIAGFSLEDNSSEIR
ncbi:hypothetical protein CEXT_348641 [Caerostris extrusa]|uniref:Uncharacterized protein n=1 Tax=Caerostris extrusa TaxID=172846 RepID=A0AAV4XWE4_CAEEX|nr:hypothetical protein CEXT_348641 [Caerostris extrusa]